MNIIEEIKNEQELYKKWRQAIHIHPETAYEEFWTSDFIVDKLQYFGITDITRGLGGTGIVATIKNGTSNKTIALRADMDALHIEEKNDFSYKSQNSGKMHACGHDGHSTMLLAAIKYLNKTKNFNGTVHFIFQPAEENEGGAQKMIEDGLFEKFQIDKVFGMHNWPALELGKMAVANGPAMAAYDNFIVTIEGKGTHAAHPDHGVDPVVVAAHIITALQSVISRSVDPLESGVLTVTQVNSGNTWNVIPNEAVLKGTVRTFKKEVQDIIESKMKSICENAAQGFGATAIVDYRRLYPATINSEIESAAKASMSVIGEENVLSTYPPSMGSEDFSFMLQKRPGCYVRLGTQTEEKNCSLHSPHYDFNDDAITIGASYWIKLVEEELNSG